MQVAASFVAILGLSLFAACDRDADDPQPRPDVRAAVAAPNSGETTSTGGDRPNSPASDSAESSAVEQLSATEIFNRRVLPILRADKASSCTECHFAGVELQNYIHEDQALTFAALRDQGLIDPKAPEKSRILQFIRRHTDDTNPAIAKVRGAELAAFQTWITAAVKEPDLLAANAGGVSIGTELPADVIQHMRRDRVLNLFVENIWSEMGRCINCHSPERNQRLVKKHGERVSWIVPHDPAATLEQLVESGNIDLANPDESYLLTKPAGTEDHGGGPKFALGSRTDKNFRRFLNDYAAVVAGHYRKSDELPPPSPEVAILTGQHLRITHLPESFDKRLLKADIYRWNGDSWSETPWATAENPIHGPKQLWQSMVFLVAPRDSKRAAEFDSEQSARLPKGRYLIKIYIDRTNRSRADRDYVLSDSDFYGQVEIEGDWPPGYQPPKVVRAPIVD